MDREGTHVRSQDLIQLRLSARNIDLDSQRRAAAVMAGLQQSRFRGRGVEFLESRGYQPGDDIRNMDWRVTARTGKPHTKVYQEERERPVIVMVDYNSSMFFGTRVAFKSVVATQLAALIGWAAIHHGDRIGAFLFGCDEHQEIAPMGGRNGILKLIHSLVRWSNQEYSDNSQMTYVWSKALQRLRRVIRPGSLIFLLSDFYEIDNESERHLTRLRQHNDMIACQISDVLELKPPPPGRYGVTDGRTTRILDTRSPRSRQQYQNYFAHHHQKVRELMRKRAIPLITLATNDNIAESLRRGLAGQIIRHF